MIETFFIKMPEEKKSSVLSALYFVLKNCPLMKLKGYSFCSLKVYCVISKFKISK